MNVQKVLRARTKHLPRLERARFASPESGAFDTRASAEPFILGFSARTNRDVVCRSDGH